MNFPQGKIVLTDVALDTCPGPLRPDKVHCSPGIILYIHGKRKGIYLVILAVTLKALPDLRAKLLPGPSHEQKP